jgi:hypothetical protein
MYYNECDSTKSCWGNALSQARSNAYSRLVPHQIRERLWNLSTDLTDISLWKWMSGDQNSTKQSKFSLPTDFQIIASQHRKTLKALVTDHTLFCSLCSAAAVQTEAHLFWEWPFASRLWTRLNRVFSTCHIKQWTPTINHVYSEFLKTLSTCKHEWELSQGALILLNWMHRNNGSFPTPEARQSQMAIACKM